MIIYNTIKFQKLSYLEKYYDDITNGIPKKSGMYYWVYYPEFNPNLISDSDLIKLLEEYSKVTLRHNESIKGPYKFHAEIREQTYPDNGELFGLTPSKSQTLIDFLGGSIPNKDFFKNFFIEICFSRPFYVGKANNLRTRLVSNHFKRVQSEILDEIDKRILNYTDIWIGFKELPLTPTGEHMNVIFEEILSRTIKPGLTKKPN